MCGCCSGSARFCVCPCHGFNSNTAAQAIEQQRQATQREYERQMWATQNAWPQAVRLNPAPAPVKPLKKVFVAGPTIAFRLWRVRRFGSGLRLGSVGATAWMLAGAPEAATCANKSGHPVPDAACTCGWYGVKDDAKLATEYRAHDEDVMVVLGHVGLWGKVIEHEHGYRAQYAYPVRIWRREPAVPLPAGFPRARLQDATLAEIADTYGCAIGAPQGATHP